MFQPLGASDYLEMCVLFDTIFIRHIPLLTLNQKSQARRLITLVDTLYDQKVHRVLHIRAHHLLWNSKPWTFLLLLLQRLSRLKVRVVILADHPLDDLFVHRGESGHEESHVLMDDLGLTRVSCFWKLNLFFFPPVRRGLFRRKVDD